MPLALTLPVQVVFVMETQCVCCEQGAKFLFVMYMKFKLYGSVPWLRRLVNCLLSRRPGFYPRPVLVRCVMDKVVLVQVFLSVFQFSFVSVSLQSNISATSR